MATSSTATVAPSTGEAPAAALANALGAPVTAAILPSKRLMVYTYSSAMV